MAEAQQAPCKEAARVKKVARAELSILVLTAGVLYAEGANVSTQSMILISTRMSR